MLKNYFTIALRNFWRNKIFSLINVLGLAIGISASLIIYLIVSYDFSFDTFQKDKNLIYRVVSSMPFPDRDFKIAGVPLPLPPTVTREITGVETASSFHLGNGEIKVSIQSLGSGKPIVYKKQRHVIYADNNYFKLISYEWLAGSPQSSLHQPFQVVLTESRAKTYFPQQDITKIIGKVITYDDSVKATVTGVVKDLDKKTDFTFKEFISYSTIENSGLKNNWGWGEWGSINGSSQFFIKLMPGIKSQQIEKLINDARKRNEKNPYLKASHYLQPLADIHFNQDYDNFNQRQAHRPTLYGLLVVGAILLLLGCINFINLTTAHSTQRAKEIGIRKTMGSSKYQLVIQFLSETFLLTLLATFLSVIIIPLLLKIFADFIPPELNISMIEQPHVIGFVIMLIIVVTVLSGFYPSLILSGYKPVLVLKNQAINSSKTRRVWFRKSLTVTQFIIAQAFVITAIIVAKQINYTLNKNLGFKKDGIITVETPWNIEEINKRNVLLRSIQAIPQIEKAVLAGSTPASENTSMQTMKYYNGKKDLETTVDVKYADSAYFNLYKMTLITGRYLLPGDSATEYVINESYARFLGFTNPADAVGKFLGGSEDRKIPVVGVLSDFYSHSLHETIKPLIYTAITPNYNQLHVLLKPDVNGNEWKTAISKIQTAYKQVYPDEDFKYNFFDESIAHFYKKEQDTSSLLKWATGIAIFISCLGMLGLAIYTTNQRTKEIGIRKVLGATVTQIVAMISKEFIMLILIAFVVAAPLAWFGMNKWLQNFAYRTDISWWIFVLGVGVMMIISLFTLAYQTIKAAIANPVKSLRTE